MIKERIHKKTLFSVKTAPNENQCTYTIEAFFGVGYFDLGVTVTFQCLQIEWEHDFPIVVGRCKEILKDLMTEDCL